MNGKTNISVSSGASSAPSIADGVRQMLKALWLEGEYQSRRDTDFLYRRPTRNEFIRSQWLATYRSPLDAAQDEFEFRGKRGW